MTATENSAVPPFGLGTFRLKGQVVRDSVRAALELGYRAIDTAQGYDNEGEIGQTIADSSVDRGELYITTKIKPDNYSAEKLVPSLRESLDRLQTDAVDLTLIHWPAPNGPVSAEEYLGALADAHSQGLTRNIGVSNFTTDLLKQARQLLGDLPITTNQVEIHPYLQNRKLADFARQEGIHLTSYMTLAVGKVMEDDVLKDIAGAHDATPAQVALAWAMQQGYSVIPSSTRRGHLESNMKALDLQLSDEDMGRIAALDGQGERLANPASVAPDWD